MHDEDCAIGLDVCNAQGEYWTAYGDKRLLDEVDKKNTEMCLLALDKSVVQVYNSWHSQSIPTDDELRAPLDGAPLLDSARGPQNCAPLFTMDGQRRANVDDRKTWQFTADWWWGTTSAKLLMSNRWSYPITLG
jgi:hypothetical protein